jgi:hypothetical protein
MKQCVYMMFGLLVLFFSANISLAQTAEAPPGSGTSGDPYRVSTLEHLYWISYQTNRAITVFYGTSFVQMNNIDASATSGWSGGGFPPINLFEGSYEGNGYTISNLYINMTSNMYVGLFGTVQWGVVKHLGIVNANISGGADVGALAGRFMNSTIRACYSSGSVSGTFELGGLVGKMQDMSGNKSTMDSCSSSCTVTVITSSVSTSYTDIGGLIGLCATSNMTECSASGNVTCSYTGSNLGGLVGRSYQGSIVSCHSTGTVSASTSSSVGGLINPSTVIRYSLPVTGSVSLKVYDVIGREVATLVNKTKEAGNYQAVFNASKLSSGVYFYRMQAGNYSSVKKLILMK